MTGPGQPSAPLLLAHGVGARADLPVPVSFAITAAALAVLISFAALGLLWPRPRLRGDSSGVPLRRLGSIVDSPFTTTVLRALVLAIAVLCVAVALVGPGEAPENLGVYAFYVTFWVGLVPASLLLGPVWRDVNPLRTLHAVLHRVTGPAPAQDRLDRLGMWPAAFFVLLYAWLELAYPERSRPVTVGIFLVVYSLVHLLASLWFGPEWFARADAFEVYSTLLGRLSAWGRRDGRLVLRNPLDNADGTPMRAGAAAVVVALLGSTGFDGIERTQWWQSGFGIAGDAALAPPTLGLLVTVAAAGLLYALATGLAGRISGTRDGPRQYAHSLIPIVAGYAIAHYFSLLFLDGQLTWILASDPFQTGLNLFGTAGDAIDYTAVSVRTISVVQVCAIVLGHILGVVLAHDRAVRLVSGARARTSQYPLLLLMVGLTCGGLRLLLG